MKKKVYSILLVLSIAIIATTIFIPNDKTNNIESLQLVDTENLSAMIKLQENMVIVDLREPELYASGRVIGAINIPFEQFENKYKELPKNKKVVFVCHTGRMGTESGNLLINNGYSQVFNLEGGMAKWTGEIENNPSPSSTEERKIEGSPNKNTNHVNDKVDILDKIESAQVIAEPDSITVLVNKQFTLPKDYEPEDLDYPNIPFIFNEKIEKRMMRKVATQALEQMVAGAKEDGIYLAGVSAYRSNETQSAVFNKFVKKDGDAKARTYSAFPGASEHETGLAIDVSGTDGKCAALDCFAGSIEAKWLDQHASEYGFIIRYPKEKESITGYQYEPWHIRYVGAKVSKEIASKGITLEEYFNI